MWVYIYDNNTEKELKNWFIWEYPERWHPWANTLLYFPLESNAVDVVNGVTLTSSWTTNYTTVGGVKSANFTKANFLYNTSVNWLPSWDVAKTMSVWIYAQGTNTFWVWIASYWADAEEPGSVFWLGLKPNSIDLVMTRAYSVSNEHSLTQDQRTNSVMTYSNSLWTLYVNGVSQVTWSETSPAYWSKVYIGQNLDWTSTASTFYGNLSNFILEDKARTATDILNYYNQTKSNYWL